MELVHAVVKNRRRLVPYLDLEVVKQFVRILRTSFDSTGWTDDVVSYVPVSISRESL